MRFRPANRRRRLEYSGTIQEKRVDWSRPQDALTMSQLRLLVIACPVFQREIELLAPAAKTLVTPRWLEMGLHERLPQELHAALQAAIDAAGPADFDAIAIAYGLCNRGILGLTTRMLPVVIPRAHDCLGLLLGSSRCYLAQLEAQPGTYFQSAGWLENSPLNGEVRQQNFTFGPNSNVTREQLVEKYGAENAGFLLEQFANFTRHYKRLAFIDTPVPEARKWEEVARDLARQRGWKFERLPGDLGWLRRLLDADWPGRDFLKLNPGERVGMRSDAQLIGAEKI
jgi:hypothetical protein